MRKLFILGFLLFLPALVFAKIQTTVWSPDTCGCVIEYEWDDSIPQEARAHTVSKIVKSCPVHSQSISKEKNYGDVLKENQDKNKAIGIIMERKPSVKVEDISFRYDSDRTLRLSIKGLDTAEKLSAETDIKTRLKIDKVIVE